MHFLKLSTVILGLCLTSTLAGVSLSGCEGFQPAHVASMPSIAFAGWTEECVANLPSNAFSQMTSDQLNQLTAAAAWGEL